jgi:hypothetical protein
MTAHQTVQRDLAVCSPDPGARDDDLTRLGVETACATVGSLLGVRSGRDAVTTNQILLGVGLTVVLAVGSQVLARSLRIPALIVLLPVGFAAGAFADVVHPDLLLGPAFQPLVSLGVALILFDAGLGLNPLRLRGHTRRIVTRLVTAGVAITWAFATYLAAPLLGMSPPAALMLGPSSSSPVRPSSARCSTSCALWNGCSGSWSGRGRWSTRSAASSARSCSTP